MLMLPFYLSILLAISAKAMAVDIPANIIK